MVMPVVLFLALGATALLLLDDYSPLLLMAGWLAGATLAWCVAAGSWAAGVLVLLALAGAVQGVLWVQGDGLAWLQAHGFYADRFIVWLEPLRHPHSGEQVLRAMRVASQGGWWGDALAPAWRVPAVQYDMAPAFFTGRFGVAAAAALLVVQLAYVGSLLMLGWQALLAAGPGDFRRRWGLRLVFFAAWGAAALFTSHLVLSWGTNTGALPVMGQPMPLLSAGSSVIAMLVAPLQMLWLLQPALLRGAVPARATRAAPRQSMQ
jgi:cell division protein FtsW